MLLIFSISNCQILSLVSWMINSMATTLFCKIKELYILDATVVSSVMLIDFIVLKVPNWKKINLNENTSLLINCLQCVIFAISKGVYLPIHITVPNYIYILTFAVICIFSKVWLWTMNGTNQFTNLEKTWNLLKWWPASF